MSILVKQMSASAQPSIIVESPVAVTILISTPVEVILPPSHNTPESQTPSPASAMAIFK